MICVRVVSDTMCLSWPWFDGVSANTSQYAHYVFNTLDQDRSGLLSFEVSLPKFEVILFVKTGWEYIPH